MLQKRVWCVRNLRFLGSLFVCLRARARVYLCFYLSCLRLCVIVWVCFLFPYCCSHFFFVVGWVEYILNPEPSLETVNSECVCVCVFWQYDWEGLQVRDRWRRCFSCEFYFISPPLSFLPSFLFLRHLVHPNLDCCNLSSPSVCYTNLDRVEELGQVFFFQLPILMTFSNLIDRHFSPQKRHFNEFSLKIVVQAFFTSDFMYLFVRFIRC